MRALICVLGFSLGCGAGYRGSTFIDESSAEAPPPLSPSTPSFPFAAGGGRTVSGFGASRAYKAALASGLIPLEGAPIFLRNQTLVSAIGSPPFWTGFGYTRTHTDAASPALPDSRAYDRCKSTARCPRGEATWSVALAAWTWASRMFKGGVSDAAGAVLSFEDWRAGTAGLASGPDYLVRAPIVAGGAAAGSAGGGAHFNSFDPRVEALLAANVEDGASLKPASLMAASALFLNHTCTVTFDTDAATATVLCDAPPIMPTFSVPVPVNMTPAGLSSFYDFVNASAGDDPLYSRPVPFAQARLPLPGWEWILGYAPVPSPADPRSTQIWSTEALVSYSRSYVGLVLRTHTVARNDSDDGDAGPRAAGAGELGTRACVFHFSSFFLGPSVRVVVQGALPVVIISRSALHLDTRVDVAPGTLGGFPGARGILTTHTNTVGPGATATRTYRWTVAVAAAPLREVQRVRLWWRQGQTLRGTFTLSLGNDTTAPIAANAEPDMITLAISESLRDAGRVTVTQDYAAETTRGGEGRGWLIRFLTAVGDVPALKLDTIRLTATGSGGDVTTLRDGNEVGGTFSLRWRGADSGALAANATGDELAKALASAWGPAGAQHVRVTASDSTGRVPLCAAAAAALTDGTFAGGTGAALGPAAFGEGMNEDAWDATDDDATRFSRANASFTLPVGALTRDALLSATRGIDVARTAPALRGSDGSRIFGGSLHPRPSPVAPPGAPLGSASTLLPSTTVLGGTVGAGSGGAGALVSACANGPGPAWGRVFSVTLVTHAGVVEALAPTSEALLAGGPRAFASVTTDYEGESGAEDKEETTAAIGVGLVPMRAPSGVSDPPWVSGESAAGVASGSRLMRLLAVTRVNATSNDADSLGELPPLSRGLSGRILAAGPARSRVWPSAPILGGVTGGRAAVASATLLPIISETSARTLRALPPLPLAVDARALTGAGAFAFVASGHFYSEAQDADAHAWLRAGDVYTSANGTLEAMIRRGATTWGGDSGGVGGINARGARAGAPAAAVARTSGLYGFTAGSGSVDALGDFELDSLDVWTDTSAWMATAAYGGAGGSHGGRGGVGHGPTLPRAPVGDPAVTFLIGGSGGAAGAASLAELLAHSAAPRGAGGAGGGAIELIATTDLVIGVHGGITVDGSDGEGGWRGGGGGAAGAIVLSAGGAVSVRGPVRASGGAGGIGMGSGARGGGGGSGGRIAVFAQSISVSDGGGVLAPGGRGGRDEAPSTGARGLYNASLPSASPSNSPSSTSMATHLSNAASPSAAGSVVMSASGRVTASARASHTTAGSVFESHSLSTSSSSSQSPESIAYTPTAFPSAVSPSGTSTGTSSGSISSTKSARKSPSGSSTNSVSVSSSGSASFSGSSRGSATGMLSLSSSLSPSSSACVSVTPSVSSSEYMSGSASASPSDSVSASESGVTSVSASASYSYNTSSIATPSASVSGSVSESRPPSAVPRSASPAATPRLGARAAFAQCEEPIPDDPLSWPPPSSAVIDHPSYNGIPRTLAARLAGGDGTVSLVSATAGATWGIDSRVGGAADSRHALRVSSAPPAIIGPAPLMGEAPPAPCAPAPGTPSAVGRSPGNNPATWGPRWGATGGPTAATSGDATSSSWAYAPLDFSGPWVAIAPVPRAPGRGIAVDETRRGADTASLSSSMWWLRRGVAAALVPTAGSAARAATAALVVALNATANATFTISVNVSLPADVAAPLTYSASVANDDFSVAAAVSATPLGFSSNAVFTTTDVNIDGAPVNLSDARAWAALTGSTDIDPWTAAELTAAPPPAAFKPRPERVSVWVRMDPAALSPGPTDSAGGDSRDAQWAPSNTGSVRARWGVHVALHDDTWQTADATSPAAASAPPPHVFAADAAAALGRECAARRISVLRTYALAAALETAKQAAADAALSYFFDQGGLNGTAFATTWLAGGGAVLGTGGVLDNAYFPPGGWLFTNVSISGNSSQPVSASVTSAANAGPTWALTEGMGGATGAGGLAPGLPALPWALLRGGGARLDAAAAAGAYPAPTSPLAAAGLTGTPASERHAWVSRDAFGFSAASAAVSAMRAAGGGMPGTGYRLRGVENDGFDALPDVTALGADGFPSLHSQTLSRETRAAAAVSGGVISGPAGAMFVGDGTDAWAGFRVSDVPGAINGVTPAAATLATAPLAGSDGANTLYGSGGGGLFTSASGRTLFAAAEAALADSGAPRDSAVAQLNALLAALAAPATLPVATGGAGVGGPGVDPALEVKRGPAFPYSSELPPAPQNAPWEAFGISARDVESACGPPTPDAPAPAPPPPPRNETNADKRVMVGVGVVSGAWSHGSNYRGAPGLALGARGASATPMPPRARYAQANRWYKLDILLDWVNSTYTVRLDDTTLALAQPFTGEGVTRVGLYVFDSTTAYFDELFVGSDDTLGFECPMATGEAKALRARRPLQTGWSTEDVGPESAHWGMRQHLSSHLARRERYSPPSKSNLVSFDGMPHRAFHADTLARRDAEGAAYDALYPEAGALVGSDAYEGGVGRGGGATMIAPGPYRMSSQAVGDGMHEAESDEWTRPTVDPDTGALPGDPLLGQSSAARWEASRETLQVLSPASLAAAPMSDVASLASHDLLDGSPRVGDGRRSELESPDGTLSSGDVLVGAMLWDAGDAPTEELLEAAQTVSSALQGSLAGANDASAAWGRASPFGNARLPPDVEAALPGLNAFDVTVPGGSTPSDRLARALWVAAILEGGGYDAAVRALAAGGGLGVGATPAGSARTAGEFRGGEAVSPGGATEGWGLLGGYGGATGRAYWFGEHDNPRHADFLESGMRLADAPSWPLVEMRPWRRGGVGSCSVSGLSGAPWRNDGIVLHFANISAPADIIAQAYADAGFSNYSAPLGRSPFAFRADSDAALSNSSNFSYWDPVTNTVVEVTNTSAVADNAAGALDDDGLPPRIVGVSDPTGDDDMYGGGVRDRAPRSPRSSAPPLAFPFRIERPKVVRRAEQGAKTVFVMWAAVEQFFDWPMGAEPAAPPVAGPSDTRAAPPTVPPTPTAGPPVDGIPRPVDLRGSIFSEAAIKTGFYNVTANITAAYGDVNVNLLAPPMHVPARPPIRMRLAGVAVSHNIAGPYTWVWSMRPDGNETVDLSVVQTPLPEGARGPPPAFLARTYYSTEAYVLPRPVMQPLWESVKNGTSAQANETDIDFALNFHRAVYHESYDLPDDMYKQQWRMEDISWSIQSAHWRETYNETYPQLPDNAAWVAPKQLFYLEKMQEKFDQSGNLFNPPQYEVDANYKKIAYSPKNRTAELHNRLSPAERKELFNDDANALAQVSNSPTGIAPHISGQGLRVEALRSRFLNPSKFEGGSLWKPESVPAVVAQTWSDNYRDKNIADNPVFPAIPDLLIGERVVIEKRRTKFVALSRLSDDYLTTTGAVTVFEGETTRGDSLLAVLAQAGLGVDTAADVAAGLRWAWDAGTGSGRNTTAQPDVTTFEPHPASEARSGNITFPTVFDTENDWKDRHWQYKLLPHDRELDFRNFRDRQFKGDNACPDIHHKHLINYEMCIRNFSAITVEDSKAVQNSKGEMQSFFQGVETKSFEDCLAESRRLLALYAACLHSKHPTGTTSVDVAMQAAIRNVTDIANLYNFTAYTENDAAREIDPTIIDRGSSPVTGLLPSFYNLLRVANGDPSHGGGVLGRDGQPISRRRQLERIDGSEDEEQLHSSPTFLADAYENEPLTAEEELLMRAMGKMT